MRSFEIWQDGEGIGCLVEDPEEIREVFLVAGLTLRLTIKAESKQEAQDKFVEWCKKQCPDAKVVPTDLSKLLEACDAKDTHEGP